MYDISGHGNHAITYRVQSLKDFYGNGATIELQYLTGGTSSTVLWPSGSIPNVFTICSITRYTAIGKKGRILVGTTMDWWHGHDDSKRGVAFYSNGWKTNEESVGELTDWMIMCGKNGGPTPNNILVDGTEKGVKNGGIGLSVLSINPFSDTNNGDWAFLELMIWDSELSESDMRVVSTALEYSLHDQVCITIRCVIINF